MKNMSIAYELIASEETIRRQSTLFGKTKVDVKGDIGFPE